MGKLRSIGSLLALTNCDIKFTLKTALLHGFFWFDFIDFVSLNFQINRLSKY